MKLSQFCFAIVIAAAAPAAFAACEIPTPPAAIPDGTTASENELLQAQSVVRNYVTAMNAYIGCENETLSVDGANATAEFRFQLSTRIDNARAEVDAVAGRFNAAVEAFRAARPVTSVPPRAPLPRPQPQQQLQQPPPPTLPPQ